MKFANVRELKNKTSEILRNAEKEAVIITSNGKPRAIVTAISEEDFEDYLLEKSAGLQDMLAEAQAEYRSKGGVTLDAYLSKGKQSVDKFQIVLSPPAIKDLDGFSDAVCGKIIRALEALRDNPFSKGKAIKKIKGTNSDYYRLRVDKYRVFYMIEGNRAIVLRILNKKDVERFIRNLN